MSLLVAAGGAGDQMAAEVWSRGLRLLVDVAKVAVKDYPTEKFGAQSNQASSRPLGRTCWPTNRWRGTTVGKIIGQGFLAPEPRVKLT
jgi:hypothetical protein